MTRRLVAGVCLVLAVVLAACGVDAPALTVSPAPSAARPSLAPSSSATPRQHAFPGPESFAAPAAPSRAPQPAAVAHTRQLNQAASYCTDRDVPAEPASDMILTVLDRTHMLSRAYVPPDLVAASAAGFSGAQGSKLVRRAIVDDLAAMRRDAAAAGLTIQLQSTYRSYASQVSTFNYWVSVYGMARALLQSARPGHSEHQLGTTIDFTSPGWGGRFGNWASETREGAWMASNAWRYGFVMSYPLGSQPRSCFSYEPWHYRWIGRSKAADWKASGLTLHEYLDGLS